MAIQSSYYSEELGITSPEAYTIINTCYIDAVKTIEEPMIVISTKTFSDITAFSANKSTIGMNGFSTPWYPGITFVDIYNWLSEQEVFVGATLV